MWAQLMYADENMETIISFGCKLVSSDGAFVECAGTKTLTAQTHIQNKSANEQAPPEMDQCRRRNKKKRIVCLCWCVVYEYVL